MPDLLIVISYFLHLIATVIWLGGMMMNALLIYPRFKGDAAIGDMNRRTQPIAMIAMAALWFSGLNQMAINPNYKGFITISNVWSLAILSKHIIVIVMMAISAYSLWVVAPELKRLSLLQAKGKLNGDRIPVLLARESRLNQFNLACGIIVLFLTAVARSA
ncbi:MAG: hypothetical protein HZB17_10240 [Chloroflexi bacterium]|nr:hypothetical protein [Chloroflexota bacterium]